MLRPESVKQMIHILIRFRDRYSRSYNVDKAHIKAMEEVAQKWQITTQTVQAMCVKRLELSSVFKFRNFLEKWILGDTKPLLELLKRFIPSRFHTEIETILVEGKFNTALPTLNARPSSTKVPVRLDENFNFSIDPETAKKLKVLSVMNGFSTSDWLKSIMTDVVRREYQTWLNSQPKQATTITGNGLQPSDTNTKRPLGRKGYQQLPDYLIPVINLIKNGMSHTNAFHQIAKKLNVTYQTVNAQCTKRLDISTEEFVELVKSNKIKSFLKERLLAFRDKVSLIEQEL